MIENRKQIEEYETIFYGTYDTIDIGVLIHKLKHLRSQGYLNVETRVDYEFDWDCPQEIFTVKAIKMRKETDKEYNARIENEEEQKRQSKENRRKHYEKLRAEFE